MNAFSYLILAHLNGRVAVPAIVDWECYLRLLAPAGAMPVLLRAGTGRAYTILESDVEGSSELWEWNSEVQISLPKIKICYTELAVYTKCQKQSLEEAIGSKLPIVNSRSCLSSAGHDKGYRDPRQGHARAAA